MGRKIRALASAIVVLTAVAACRDSGAQTPARVTSVVERTKANRTNYALYNWFRMPRAGGPAVEEWAAEFNSGRFHRVETPNARVVADCEAMTGSALSVPTGEITTGRKVAVAVCGINTNFEIASAEWLGQDKSAFGAADIIRLSGGPVIRTYEVDPNGVIVRASYHNDAPGHPVALETLSTDLSAELPAEDMFTDESLSRSYVPEAYKSGPVGHRWIQALPSPS